MILEFHDKLTGAQRVTATRLVVHDEQLGPIAIIIEPTPHNFYIVDRGDGDQEMNAALRALGIRRTVISDIADSATLQALPDRTLPTIVV